MERETLNSEGLKGNFKKDSELIRGFYFALPQINLINLFIYQMHHNFTFNCIQSILEYDYNYEYHDKPQFVDLSFTQESLLKPEIKDEKIILNQNETSFINNLYFEKEANKRFITFRTSLNSFLLNYKSQHQFEIIHLLKNLISTPFEKITDSSKIVGPNLNYPRFKDIVRSQLDTTNNNIRENILNLQNLNEEEPTFVDRLMVKALKSDNKDLLFFIQKLDQNSLDLFALKWENKAFNSIKLLFEFDKKSLSDNMRMIYFLVQPQTIHHYKSILNALPQEYDSDNAKRYFDEINTSSNHDLLMSKKKCINIKNLIDLHLN